MASNIFAGLFSRRPNTLEINNEQPLITNLPEDKMLQYLDCQNIYTYWGLGKRVIHALPRFAFSAPREIAVQDAPPEAIEEFKTTAENLKQDRICRRASILARIYGMSGLFVAYKSLDAKENTNNNLKDNLTHKHLQSGKIAFNALGPLNLSGTVFSQDATSTAFQRPVTIVVKGNTVGSKRATVIQNSEPIYLRFTDPTFSFAGISVYQNMVPLIKSWAKAVISLKRMATKASAIVFKDGTRGKMTGLMADAAQKSLQRIRDMENDGATSIDKDGDVTFFPLTGVQEVDAIMKGLERELMMALDDTPASILLDKDLSNGLSEGTEDMKAVIMAVENFREEVLTPLYALTDPFVQAVAWSDRFIKSIIEKYPDQYSGFSPAEIRQSWQDSFSYEYGNLYPAPEKEVEEMNGLILDNLAKAKALGANIADIEAEIRERKLFKNDMTLDEPVEEPIEGEEDGKDTSPDTEE